MIIFDNDEKEYLRWIRKNPKGFVVNASKQKSGNPALVLHKANCLHISTTTGEISYTTTAYKVCSLNRQELVDWANKTSGGFNDCKTCGS